MSLMVDGESGISSGDEDLFLERHHVSRIALLISDNGVEVDVLRTCGRIDNLATSEVVVRL